MGGRCGRLWSRNRTKIGGNDRTIAPWLSSQFNSIVPEGPHWLPRSIARSERASRTGGSPRARDCPLGVIWPRSWASLAALCVWLMNVSSRSNLRLVSGRQARAWPRGSPDPQHRPDRRKPRFCRSSSTSSEARRGYFRWASPLKTPSHSSCGHTSWRERPGGLRRRR
jgi:hypothetical protein